MSSKEHLTYQLQKPPAFLKREESYPNQTTSNDGRDWKDAEQPSGRSTEKSENLPSRPIQGETDSPQERELDEEKEVWAIGRADFLWREALSENAQQLYLWLIADMGDREFLSIHAAEDGWDLDAALAELREHEILDESDPEIIRIVRTKL